VQVAAVLGLEARGLARGQAVDRLGLSAEERHRVSEALAGLWGGEL
jgi:hypothetical protein